MKKDQNRSEATACDLEAPNSGPSSRFAPVLIITALYCHESLGIEWMVQSLYNKSAHKQFDRLRIGLSCIQSIRERADFLGPLVVEKLTDSYTAA